ncbi:hypothetical protein Hte_010763 [Hypoxylon texense]
MSDEMNPHKGRQASNSSSLVAEEPESKFENIDLLQHLIGDSKRKSTGRYDTPSEQSLRLRDSTDGVPTNNPPSISAAPSSYRESSLPEMAISESISTKIQADSSDHSYKSLIVLRSSSTPSLHAASPQIQRLHARPVSEPNLGLNALFQQPARLKSHSESVPTGTVALPKSSGSSSASSSLRESLYTTSSMTSLHSPISELDAYSEISRPESHTSQQSTTHHRPALASYSSDPDIKAKQNLKDTTKTSIDLSILEPRNRIIALSCLSAYYARLADQPARVKESVPLESGDSHSLGSEGIPSRPGSPSSTAADPDSSASTEDLLAPQPPNSGLMIVTPKIATRRDVADSQAWQRKTRMLQVD